MPPKKTTPKRWGDEHKQAILTGFRDHGWNPEEQSGVKINALIKSVPELLAILQPFFSINEGGTKTSNNQLYEHFKSVGCEFIVAKTRDGFRRQTEGACLRSVDPGRRHCFASLTLLLLFLLLPAAYVADQGLSGARAARKRSAEDDEDSDGSGGISLGSVDTDSDSDVDMSSKKAAAGPKKAAEAPASAAPKSKKEDDFEEFVKRAMAKMSLKDAEAGFNFNCPFPHFWWTYPLNGVKYVKVEFLVWATFQDEIAPTLSKDGKILYLKCKIPEVFLKLARLFPFYTPNGNDPATGNPYACSIDGLPDNTANAMYSNGKAHVSSFRNSFDMEAIARTPSSSCHLLSHSSSTTPTCRLEPKAMACAPTHRASTTLTARSSCSMCR